MTDQAHQRTLDELARGNDIITAVAGATPQKLSDLARRIEAVEKLIPDRARWGLRVEALEQAMPYRIGELAGRFDALAIEFRDFKVRALEETRMYAGQVTAEKEVVQGLMRQIGALSERVPLNDKQRRKRRAK
jgi:hypothetical protein